MVVDQIQSERLQRHDIHVQANRARLKMDPTLDVTVERVHAQRTRFARLRPADKAALVRACLPTLAECAETWVAESCRAKGIRPDSPAAGEEWMAGPYPVARYLRQLARSLDQIARHGKPRPGTAVREGVDGQLSVRVFPGGLFDALSMPDISAEVQLMPGIDRQPGHAHQAAFYAQAEPSGHLSLVLGAGNVASIPPLDALGMLFIDGKVCLVKLNPVNAYLGPVYEQALAPLVSAGYLAFVAGDGEVGAYLCQHPSVERVHITGSDTTFERIVWGPSSEERHRRKQSGEPLLSKPITAELGNVTPLIVVPGSYSTRQLWFQARNLATMVANNASFNCTAAKMLIVSKRWRQRDAFVDLLRRALAQLPTRRAYYPGAFDRYQQLTQGRPHLERIGTPAPADLPWTLVHRLDPRSDDPLFRIEPFCSILSITELEPGDPTHFLRAATEFANERLWGTLSAMLVAPSGLSETAAMAAAIRDLRYGTVVLNHWSSLGFAWGSTPWGAYPGATLADPQSGIGWVHNSHLLEDIHKVVIRGPLTTAFKPAWFADNASGDRIGRALFGWLTRPSARGLAELGRATVRG